MNSPAPAPAPLALGARVEGRPGNDPWAVYDAGAGDSVDGPIVHGEVVGIPGPTMRLVRWDGAGRGTWELDFLRPERRRPCVVARTVQTGDAAVVERILEGARLCLDPAPEANGCDASAHAGVEIALDSFLHIDGTPTGRVLDAALRSDEITLLDPDGGFIPVNAR